MVSSVPRTPGAILQPQLDVLQHATVTEFHRIGNVTANRSIGPAVQACRFGFGDVIGVDWIWYTSGG